MLTQTVNKMQGDLDENARDKLIASTKIESIKKETEDIDKELLKIEKLIEDSDDAINKLRKLQDVQRAKIGEENADHPIYVIDEIFHLSKMIQEQQALYFIFVNFAVIAKQKISCHCQILESTKSIEYEVTTQTIRMSEIVERIGTIWKEHPNLHAILAKIRAYGASASIIKKSLSDKELLSELGVEGRLFQEVWKISWEEFFQQKTAEKRKLMISSAIKELQELFSQLDIEEEC